MDPTPEIAKRVEEHMKEIGEEIFKLIFRANDDTSNRLFAIKDRLGSTRIQVETDAKVVTDHHPMGVDP